MPFPYLAFSPYLDMNEPSEFGDWELGPLAAFEERWADLKFKTRAKAFLAKFVDGQGQPVERPSLLCRRQGKLDGAFPSLQEQEIEAQEQEIEALRAAIAFAFLDTNPRRTSSNRQQHAITADNTELFFWPIDVDDGSVTFMTGIMVKTRVGGYRTSDEHLAIRPPLDMCMPRGTCTADPMCLEAVYQTVRQALRTPGVDVQADHLRPAIGWFTKAWRNTETVQFPERVVFLKTAFEALSGTNKSYRTAHFLRELFEAIPRTAPLDSTRLVWSPAERPVHTHTYMKNGKPHSVQITDLEHWFMAYAKARNEVIHEGKSPPLEYSGSNAAYDGHFVFMAEFLLRAAIKVWLSSHGYPDLWRSDLWRTVQRAFEEHEARARVVQQDRLREGLTDRTQSNEINPRRLAGENRRA